jgi:DNA processing protein
MQNLTIKAISDAERINWIRLSRTKNIGKSTFYNLLKLFGNVEDAIKNVEEYSLKGGLRIPIKVLDEDLAIKELENCRRINAEIITFIEPQYPELLKQISDPPPVITVRGNTDLLSRDIISIVGPRNSSINGYKFARIIAAELGKEGLVVASGMARGIDSAAHFGALETGTIAVIAGGIEHIYPPENKELYYQIVEKGAIISEIPFGVLPRGGNFPQRNRIISGMALGVVIVEATLKSGTLITARFALEQNRDIFAVPGSPFDPRHQGTNRLIKQGAKLIENVDDILEEINHLRARNLEQLEMREKELPDFTGFSTILADDDEVDEARKLILRKINYAEIMVDEIISEFQIPPRVVNIALVQLELADKIEYKNGRVTLKL